MRQRDPTPDLTTPQPPPPRHGARGGGAPVVPARDPASHPFATHVNPRLAGLLRGLRADERFVRGQGCWLEDAAGRRCLDGTAAYGALPFGYHPPEIWDAIRDVESSREPTVVPLSLNDAAGALAERLVALAPAGINRVAFANSGAEAVEAAIKLARAATGRMGILAMENGFHGQTLGALSATGRAGHQTPFGAPAPGFVHVPFGDADAVEDAFAEAAGEFAACIVEAIQGEGGIVVPPDDYLAAVRAACLRHDVLMIVDEGQTGLGRTGRLFAAGKVEPDIVTLAEALGGGLVPAAAVLYGDACDTEAFALKHTSTFAPNALACRVGLRVLDLLTRDDGALVRQVAEHGRYLREGLEALQRRHPRLIESVRGRGYLLGLELTRTFQAFGRQTALGSLAEQETLAAVLCSYMLNVEGVRLAPTLLGRRVIRIEPALVAGREECDGLLEALGRALDAAAACDVARILGPIAGREAMAVEREPPPLRAAPPASPRPGEPRFAFVVHPFDLSGYRDLDEGFDAFTDDELRELVGRLRGARGGGEHEAVVVGTGRVTSASGSSAFGELIGVRYTAEELLALPRASAVAAVREAVELAADRGADVVGLGGHTATVAQYRMALRGVNVPVTTGNGLAAACAVEAVRSAAAARTPALSHSTAVVLGAGGPVGRVVSALLADEVGRLVLAGSPGSPDGTMERLEEVSRAVVSRLREARRRASATRGTLSESLDGGTEEEQLARLRASGRVELATDPLSRLGEADVVVTCPSAPAPLFDAGRLKRDALVCDVARPSDVGDVVAADRSHVAVVGGGIVELPGRQDVGMRFGLEPGLVHARMAETMLLCLERRYDLASVGPDLSLDAVATLGRWAAHHGFRCATSPARGRSPADSPA